MAYDGYIRVSQVGKRKGESFQSPDQQRQAIEGWALSKGKKIGASEEDLDVSGGTLTRPGLDRIMERIRAGKSEGIVVARLDRLSRAGVGEALELCEEIYEAGAQVVAIDVGIDPTTTVGEFAMTLMLALARMERRRIREGWQSARERAVTRGAFLGPTPLGYDKLDTGALTPNDTDGPLMGAAFDVSANEGIKAVTGYFKATWPERFWTRTTVRRILSNRVYLGEIRHGEDLVNLDAHEPLTDQITWDLAQHPELAWKRQPNGKYPLSGIATCAACGGPLLGQTTGRPGKPYRRYHCKTQTCTARPHVSADQLETFALDAIRDSDVVSEVTASAEEVFKRAQAIMRAAHELRRYLDDTEAASIVGPEAWREGLRTRQAAVEQAQHDADVAREASRELPDLDEPTPDEQRTIFERTITKLVVCRSKAGTPIADRSQLTLA